jgi:transposase
VSRGRAIIRSSPARDRPPMNSIPTRVPRLGREDRARTHTSKTRNSRRASVEGRFRTLCTRERTRTRLSACRAIRNDHTGGSEARTGWLSSCPKIDAGVAPV